MEKMEKMQMKSTPPLISTTSLDTRRLHDHSAITTFTVLLLWRSTTTTTGTIVISLPSFCFHQCVGTLVLRDGGIIFVAIGGFDSGVAVFGIGIVVIGVS